MKEHNTFRERRKQHDLKLIKAGNIFNSDKGGKNFFLKNEENPDGIWRPKADLLIKGKNNLYPLIADEVVLYFALNNISFHHLEGDTDFGFCIPSGHTLSSQISCLNHLYPLRYDKYAVLAIAQQINSEIIDVLIIETDKFLPGYIAFEVISDNDHLNETKGNQKLTRGTLCTSVDAMIYGQLKNDKKIIIPIEWKYTENYHDDHKTDKDYSIENRGKEKEGKGKERLRRYSKLITNSKQLSVKKASYKSSVYYFEPFYQLMRQTLWTEQMLENKASEIIKAEDFIHVHTVPSDNKELMQYQYPASGKGLLDTWKSCLICTDKYKLIEPKYLFSKINKKKYESLIDYLTIRYWDGSE
ncbi:MAG: hypothetical protein Q8R90_01690 [Bacteroidales bacterium]|nr:hypothetical protein [Bacteroidales bacterium]